MGLKTTNHLVSNLYFNKTRLKVVKCFDDVQSFIFDVKFGVFYIYLGGWSDLESKVEFSVLSAPLATLKTTKQVGSRKTVFCTLLTALRLWENLPFRDKNEQFITIFENLVTLWILNYVENWLDLESKVEFSVLSAPPATLKTTKQVGGQKTAFWTLLTALGLWENFPFWDKNEPFIIIF